MKSATRVVGPSARSWLNRHFRYLSAIPYGNVGTIFWTKRRLGDGSLPVIARLGGIVIVMHFQEHNPPHFPVNSGGVRAVVGIDPPEIREGWLSSSDRHVVLPWTRAHQAELLANWDRVIRHEQPVKIDERS